MHREQTETRTPRDFLEQDEERDNAAERPIDHNDMAFAIGRMLAWMLEARSIVAVGNRVHIAAHKLRPDLVKGMSLDGIAKKSGQRRSAAHKLSKEFEQIFGIHGIHDRSEEARKKYAESWRRVNGPQPHTYNPAK